MLVLQRKKGEELFIDDKITIRISDMGSDWVKLMIDAPKDVRIMRKELLEAADLNKESAKPDKDNLMQLKSLIHKKL